MTETETVMEGKPPVEQAQPGDVIELTQQQKERMAQMAEQQMVIEDGIRLAIDVAGRARRKAGRELWAMLRNWFPQTRGMRCEFDFKEQAIHVKDKEEGEDEPVFGDTNSDVPVL